MSHTARLKLPFIHSGQAQKEITHNEALIRLDALVNPVAQALSVTSPPNATIGQLYIIGNEPEEGIFARHANRIAVKMEHGWHFIKPLKWLEVTLDADGSKYRFDGTSWVASPLEHNMRQLISPEPEPRPQQQPPPLPPPPQANNIWLQQDSGEYLKIEHLQEEITLRGAYTNSRIKIPHHCIVLAVNIRVIEQISGANSFSIGVDGAVDRYGNNLGTNRDTTNIGLTNHPMTYWQDTAIRITAKNGSFTSGKVKVTLQCIKPHGPWNWQ